MPLANNDQVSQQCDVQSMSPSAPHARELMHWMVVDSRDRWPTRSHCHVSVQRSTGSCNSLQRTVPLMGRRPARQRATICIGDVWVRGGTANCRTCAIVKRGRRTSVWVTYDRGGRLPEGVLSWGRDCCVGVGSNETAAAEFRLRYGVERLLTND